MISLLFSQALACGGLFCSAPILPVNQAGERIVFALDEAAQEVEMHTKIAYEGPAREFAWLVPLPAVPELFVSTDELFTFLDRNTAPIFALQTLCPCCIDTTDTPDLSDTGSPAGPAAPDPVVVVARGLVGPYDSVVLQATSTPALLDWLNDNAYFVPAGVTPFLDPYVSAGSYVVALKLQKNRDVGDLVPLGLRFPGTAATIPLVMTAVAATPDMAIIPWVLGAGRAVPSNYLHVQINELAIDWSTAGANYNEVVGDAADLAGGHAFATDFAGPTSGLRDRLVWPGRYNVSALRNETTVRGLWGSILSQGFVIDDLLTGLMSASFPESDAVLANISEGGDTGFFTERDYVCDEPGEIGCDPVDPSALIDQLVAQIIEPNNRANALFDQFPYITRLTSSASPAEMTLDPLFVINRSLPDVPQVRRATLELGGCNDGFDRFTLADGTTVDIPADQAAFNYMRGFRDLPARRIEMTSASGPPQVLVDRGPEIDALVAELSAVGGGAGDTPGDPNDTPSEPSDTPGPEEVDTVSGTGDDPKGAVAGCGCDAGGPGAGWGSLLVMGGLLQTRRSRRRAG